MLYINFGLIPIKFGFLNKILKLLQMPYVHVLHYSAFQLMNESCVADLTN